MQTAKQRITSFVLALALVIGAMAVWPPLTVSAAEIPHNMANGSLVITSGDNGNDYLVTGSTSSNYIKVESGYAGNITLQDVEIARSGVNNTTFEIASGATVHLTLEGDNTLKSGAFRPGLQAPAGAMLVIAGTGSLEATGGAYCAGIGGGQEQGGGAITITGKAVVTATGGAGGAGIGGGGGYLGGGDGGTIVITGAATVTASGGMGGAGIGGGNERGFDAITIDTTGQVTAYGGDGGDSRETYYAGGAGIGGGGKFTGAPGTIEIAHRTSLTATGGAAHTIYPYGSGAAVGNGGPDDNTNGGDTPHITTPRALPPATVGVAYDETIRAYVDGGDANFMLVAGNGEHNPGLDIRSDAGADYAVGTLFGTPTTPGTYTFTVTAENGGKSHSAQFTLIVLAPKELGDYIVTSNSVDLTDTDNIALASDMVTIKAPGDYRFAMKQSGTTAQQGIQVADNVTGKVELTLAEISMENVVEIGSGAQVALTLVGDSEIKSPVLVAKQYTFALDSSAQVVVDGSGTLNCENTSGLNGIGIGSGAWLAIVGGKVTASGNNIGISVSGGTIEVTGGELTAQSGDRGISVYGGTIEVTGGELTAQGSDSDLKLEGNSRLTMDGPAKGARCAWKATARFWMVQRQLTCKPANCLTQAAALFPPSPAQTR